MSLQLTLTNAWLRRFMKGRRPLPANPAQARQRMRAMLQLLPAQSPGVVQRPAQAEGLCPAVWLRPQGLAAPRTLMYLHGGGYFFGSPATHRQICCALALRCQAQVLAVDYRLAPEHPFPAALEDSLAWYRRLLADGVDPRHLALAGDSAGGGLAVALLVAARDAGLPLPACAALFSPWTDLANTGASVQQCTRSDVVFHPQWLHESATFYLQGQDACTPLASPLYADLHGLPPVLLFASQHELLRDDAVRLADRAREQGVAVQLELHPGVPHVWPVMTHLPEAREALAQVAGFVQRHTVADSV